MGVPSPTHRSPRPERKLQTAIESVAGVDKPTPCALAPGHSVQFCVIWPHRKATVVAGLLQRLLRAFLGRWEYQGKDYHQTSHNPP